jgi:SNF2 family DNA or RNA helicase
LLWAQHYIVDQGATLGQTLGLFRAAFFTARENIWAKSDYAKIYKFDRRKKDQLMRMVQHRSLSYSAEECIDVPSFNPVIESVRLPEEAGAYYKRVVDQIIAARGNLSEMKNAFMRMRQLSSGFLGFRDEDDDGKRVEIAFGENPKLELLLDLLQSLPDDRKAVVFYEFTWSGRKIVEQLRELKEKPIWLWSGTKNSAGEIERFLCDPGCRVAVLNNRVGAYSLDGLQDVANYTLFYESPVSVIDREQAERRLRRDGQKFKVFQYDLVVEDTMDRNILAYHREGDDLLEALRKNPRRFFNG